MLIFLVYDFNPVYGGITFLLSFDRTYVHRNNLKDKIDPGAMHAVRSCETVGDDHCM